jgi:hypothetical protein
LTAFCRKLQTPQFTERQGIRPCQHDTAGYAAHHLFTGPQRLVPVLRANQQQLFQRQAMAMQGRRVGDPRRVDHGNPVIFLAEPRKHRHKQAEFPATGRIIDKFRDRSHRPAIAR